MCERRAADVLTVACMRDTHLAAMQLHDHAAPRLQQFGDSPQRGTCVRAAGQHERLAERRRRTAAVAVAAAAHAARLRRDHRAVGGHAMLAEQLLQAAEGQAAALQHNQR